jgi:hypothetical protein
MVYISTESDCERLGIKHGQLSENPLRGSTARYVANHIVDDIDLVDPDAPADPIHPKIEYVPPSCKIVGDPSTNDLATKRWGNEDAIPDAKTEADLIRRIQDGARTRASKPTPHEDDQRAFNKLIGKEAARREMALLEHAYRLVQRDPTMAGKNEAVAELQRRYQQASIAFNSDTILHRVRQRIAAKGRGIVAKGFVDPDATADVMAIRYYMTSGSNSGKIPEEAPPNFSTMMDAQLRQWKKDNFRR